MFALRDSWVWDFWFADDGDTYHLFFLYASRALHDPEDRHYRASIGHATSTDLKTWTRIEDALVRGAAGDFDDLATWTGSTVRHPDGTWFTFYTGSRLAPGGKNVQSIGYATSPDLITWTKSPDNPILRADPRWYETLADAAWHDEAFRDPWVFPDPDGDGWHMLVTARGRTGDPYGRGVVGHARSTDLRTWSLQPPLTAPTGNGFGQLEVLQVADVDGRAVLLFSCLAEHATAGRRALHGTGGIWAAPAGSVRGPFHLDDVYPLTDDRLYVGRLLQRRDDGKWLMFAFHHTGSDGAFVGGVSDPIPVEWQGDRLVAPALYAGDAR
jgi:sucrose-6-phosphate hydrolase SacC (GH32 family)